MGCGRLHHGLAVGGRFTGGGRAGEGGQASQLLLGVVAVLLAGLLVLLAFGQAWGPRARQQRAADLAAISAGPGHARQLRTSLRAAAARKRPAEPATPLQRGVPGVGPPCGPAWRRPQRPAGGPNPVSFPGTGFAPTRVRVELRGEAQVRLSAGSSGRAASMSRPARRPSSRRTSAGSGCLPTRAAVATTARSRRGRKARPSFAFRAAEPS
jgi:hypothetical protein